VLSLSNLRLLQVVWALPDGMPEVLAWSVAARASLRDRISSQRPALLRPSGRNDNLQKSPGPVDETRAAKARSEVAELRLACSTLEPFSVPALRGIDPQELIDALLQFSKDRFKIIWLV